MKKRKFPLLLMQLVIFTTGFSQFESDTLTLELKSIRQKDNAHVNTTYYKIKFEEDEQHIRMYMKKENSITHKEPLWKLDIPKNKEFEKLLDQPRIIEIPYLKKDRKKIGYVSGMFEYILRLYYIDCYVESIPRNHETRYNKFELKEKELNQTTTVKTFVIQNKETKTSYMDFGANIYYEKTNNQFIKIDGTYRNHIVTGLYVPDNDIRYEFTIK